MKPTLLMLHGWGLNASLWDGVRAALPEFDAIVWDRGYFGAPSAMQPAGPVLAIGHSLGALLLADLPQTTRLVAINGFDRFTGEDAVPPRVVERMRRRFSEAPREVLAEFRNRIGAGFAPKPLNEEQLAADLMLLAEADTRGSARPSTLVLQGETDPLLPPTMRNAVFAGAPRKTLAGAGHLLPLSHPAWVAERIRAFAG
jgi:pimeloyl-[acyl-carrier protein] methyl ester esterase